MAKMIGVFSHIKGKIGNIIYATWHGVQVIKTMFIPANPQSADQTSHRDIFLFLVQLGELIFDDIITVIWNPFRRKASSGWSNWLKANLLLQTGATIDYSIFVLSQGSIYPSAVKTSVYTTGTGACVIEFLDTSLNNQEQNDLVGAFVIDDASDNNFYNASLAAKRSDGTITVTCDTGLTPANCHAYLFFVRKSGTVITKVSNSTYLICSAP